MLRKAGAVDDVCYLRGEGVYAGWKQKAGQKLRGEGVYVG